MKTIRTILLLSAALAATVGASASPVTITPGQTVKTGTFTVTVGTITGSVYNNSLPTPTPQNTTVSVTENSPTSISVTFTGDFGVMPIVPGGTASQVAQVPYTMTLGSSGKFPYWWSSVTASLTDLEGQSSPVGDAWTALFENPTGIAATWYTGISSGDVSTTIPIGSPGCGPQGATCYLFVDSWVDAGASGYTTFSSATFTLNDALMTPEPATGVLWGIGAVLLLVAVATKQQLSSSRTG